MFNKFVEKVEMKVVAKYEEWEFVTFLHTLVKKNKGESYCKLKGVEFHGITE